MLSHDLGVTKKEIRAQAVNFHFSLKRRRQQL